VRVLVAFRNCGRNHLDAIVDSSSGKPLVLDGAQLACVQEECTSFNDVASLQDAHPELAYRYGGIKGGDKYRQKRHKRANDWGRTDLASRRRRLKKAKKDGQDGSSALNPEADSAGTTTESVTSCCVSYAVCGINGCILAEYHTGCCIFPDYGERLRRPSRMDPATKALQLASGKDLDNLTSTVVKSVAAPFATTEPAAAASIDAPAAVVPTGGASGSPFSYKILRLPEDGVEWFFLGGLQASGIGLVRQSTEATFLTDIPLEPHPSTPKGNERLCRELLQHSGQEEGRATQRVLRPSSSCWNTRHMLSHRMSVSFTGVE
jgi:hypothetical protein